jgi:pyruvate formate lyase activating enzyme
LLDIKATDPEGFKKITGLPQDTMYQLIDIINKHKKHVWVRYVVVPGINDTEADIEALNSIIAKIDYVDKVELLGYHTMAVNKYDKMGIPYRLEGVPAMDSERLAELKSHLKY